MITLNDWKKAGDFSDLVRGKKYPLEVSEEIYTDMLGVLPPQEFQNKNWKNYKERNLTKKYHEYFLVGEPTAHVGNELVYASFGYRTESNKHYFIGYLTSTNHK